VAQRTQFNPRLPPRPASALRATHNTGLDVRIAPIEHLLAMKITAVRHRDVDDTAELA